MQIAVDACVCVCVYMCVCVCFIRRACHARSDSRTGTTDLLCILFAHGYRWIGASTQTEVRNVALQHSALESGAFVPKFYVVIHTFFGHFCYWARCCRGHKSSQDDRDSLEMCRTRSLTRPWNQILGRHRLEL